MDAEEGAKRLYRQGIDEIASLVKNDGWRNVVVNPSSWPRTDVRLWNAGDEPGCAMVVKDVPPCGYRVLKDERFVGAVASPGAQTEIESRYYRVVFNPATGGVKSIFDKELGKELVDAKTPYGANQYVYVAGAPARGSWPTRTAPSPRSPSARRVLRSSAA